MKRVFKNGLAALLALIIMITGTAYAIPAGAAQSDIPEWAIDDDPDAGFASTGAMWYPAAYDLRNEGVVTPVKDQGYWGTCWAFGPIAAAETSILSSFGATYAQSGFDLSERHLAYYALDHVTENVDPSQAGEGTYLFDEEEDPNARFEIGGDFLFVTTLFAQGVGPLPESGFPYRGVNENGESTYIAEDCLYSADDDWSIPEFREDGYPNRCLTYGFVLKDGNTLYYRDDDSTDGLPSGIGTFKQELINGRAIAIGSNTDHRYMASSEEMGNFYASYCYDDLDADHIMCIVGWDDNYDASNFTHTKDGKGNPMTDLDGNPISDEEAAELTTPPGNGAWIVKNSWGSETDWIVDDLGNIINKYDVGVRNEDGEGTGYLYLSYYDKSLNIGETYDFTSELGWGEPFHTCQYDYMPGLTNYYYEYDYAPMSSANVFYADNDYQLKCVSTSTQIENSRVTFAIYLLNEDAKGPTDGQIVSRFSRNFELPGFHRVTLDRPIYLEEGQLFSVVSTATGLDDEGNRYYGITANRGKSKAFSEATDDVWYSKAVVNEGESFVYMDGEWSDWSEYIEGITVNEDYEYSYISQYYIDFNPIDNFSIKAYLVPLSDDTRLLGDVNLNGEVEITDATLIQQYLADMTDLPEDSLMLADVDADGSVTVMDATYIQRWLAELPCPEGIGKPT